MPYESDSARLRRRRCAALRARARTRAQARSRRAARRARKSDKKFAAQIARAQRPCRPVSRRSQAWHWQRCWPHVQRWGCRGQPVRFRCNLRAAGRRLLARAPGAPAAPPSLGRRAAAATAPATAPFPLRALAAARLVHVSARAGAAAPAAPAAAAKGALPPPVARARGHALERHRRACVRDAAAAASRSCMPLWHRHVAR